RGACSSPRPARRRPALRRRCGALRRAPRDGVPPRRRAPPRPGATPRRALPARRARASPHAGGEVDRVRCRAPAPARALRAPRDSRHGTFGGGSFFFFAVETGGVVLAGGGAVDVTVGAGTDVVVGGRYTGR